MKHVCVVKNENQDENNRICPKNGGPFRKMQNQLDEAD